MHKKQITDWDSESGDFGYGGWYLAEPIICHFKRDSKSNIYYVRILDHLQS